MKERNSMKMCHGYLEEAGLAWMSVRSLAREKYWSYSSSNNLPASSFRADSAFGTIKRHLIVCEKIQVVFKVHILLIKKFLHISYTTHFSPMNL